MEAIEDADAIEAPPKGGILKRSPITDPRSLASSFGFHALVIVAASLAAFRASLPTQAPPRVVQAELGPVDNRAPAETGGGAPGELGGDTLPESIRIAADGRSPESAALRDPAAEEILADVLPAPSTTDPDRKAPPGPIDTGVGVLLAEGKGGGQGAGGGSGGGSGRGIGPGTEFFGAREQGVSFAYVIDCSGSMAEKQALDLAKRELLASVRQLPPDARFAVIFYNLKTTTFADAAGREGLMPASAENKERVRERLRSIRPDGGTDHLLALRAAFAMKPEVVFFLTDAAQLTRDEVEAIGAEAGSSRIQAVEFGIGPSLGISVPLKTLANATGGQYRYVDVEKKAPPG